MDPREESIKQTEYPLAQKSAWSVLESTIGLMWLEFLERITWDKVHEVHSVWHIEYVHSMPTALVVVVIVVVIVALGI